MNSATETIELTRDCEAVQIPAGHNVTLVKGTKAVITQSLGGSYTLQVPSLGGLFRISGTDADAVGVQTAAQPESAVQDRDTAGSDNFEKQIWDQLKTCFDPEIPLNIVDLGLIYEMKVSSLQDGAHKVDVKMTLTAQGCGMGGVIASDAKNKLLTLPGVKEAHVEIVWSPPWTRDRISPEGKEKLGIK